MKIYTAEDNMPKYNIHEYYPVVLNFLALSEDLCQPILK